MHSYLCFSFLWKTVFEHLNNFLIPLDNFQSIKPLFSSCLDRSYCNLDPSRFLDFVSIASRQILDQSRNFLSSWQILDPSRLASVDSYSTTSRSIEILLHTLFFTCFASLFYLLIHIILFYYIHAFIWIPCAPLVIFMFLGWSFLASCTFCQSWTKWGEIVEKMWFLFKILHVRGRNTCLCKGELCFILLGGASFNFFFLYTGLVTIFYIHCAYLWYI